MKRIILLLISFTVCTMVNGQIRGLVNNYIQRGNVDREVEAIIPMAVIEKDNNVFSTGKFSESFPGNSIPVESIELSYPDLSDYADTIYLVWFLKDMSYARKGVNNIIILAVTKDSEIDYYFDNNNDRSYSDEETVKRFETYEKQAEIDMKFGENNTFIFSNPFYEEPQPGYLTKINVLEWSKYKNKLIFSWSTGFSFGAGDAHISYVPLDATHNRIEYFAGIFASLRFNARLGLEWKHLALDGILAYEVLDYDELQKYYYDDDSRNIVYNTGVWMKNKFLAGAEVGYDIPFGKMITFGPAISYYKWKAIGNKPIDPELNYPSDAKYNNTSILEYAVRMRVISSPSSKLEIRVFYSDTSIGAEEFFPDYGSDYKSEYLQIYFGATYIQRFN